MKDELQQQLFDKYPVIFSLTDKETRNPIAWGIEHGDGWYKILDEACAKLKFMTDTSGIPIMAAQIKEKWAGLRFYTHLGSNEADLGKEEWDLVRDIFSDIVGAAERTAYQTCEDCGGHRYSDKAPSSPTGWVHATCDACFITRMRKDDRMTDKELEAYLETGKHRTLETLDD